MSDNANRKAEKTNKDMSSIAADNSCRIVMEMLEDMTQKKRFLKYCPESRRRR